MCALILVAIFALPEGAVARLGATRLRAHNAMLAVAFSPDGKTLATSSAGNHLAFWEVPGFKLRLRISLGATRVSALQFSPDGKRLYASTVAAILVVDPARGAERLAIHDPEGGSMGERMVLSPDGSLLLAWPENGRDAILFDALTGAVRRRMPNLASATRSSVAFVPDGKRFIAPWSDSRLHLISTATGESIRCLEPEPRKSDRKGERRGRRGYSRHRPPDAAITPNGVHVVYRPYRGEEYIIREVETGKIVRRVPVTSERYRTSDRMLALSPDGRLAFEADGGKVIRIHGLASGKLLRSLPVEDITRFALSPDGKLLAHVDGHAVIVWDLATGRPAAGGPAYPASGLAFVSGDRLVSRHEQGWRVWNASTGQELGYYRGVPAPLQGVRLVEGGKTLEFVATHLALHRWRVGQERSRSLTEPRRSPLRRSRTAVSPDGHYQAGTVQGGSKLMIFPLQGEEPAHELAAIDDLISPRLAFSPDGQTLAVAHRGHALSLFDRKSGERRQIDWSNEPAEESVVARLAFSPGGQSLAFASAVVPVVETASAGERFRVPGCAAGMARPQWSADGRLLALGRADGIALVIDTLSGREVFRCRTPEGGIGAVAIREDGRRLATTCDDSTIVVWKVPRPPELSKEGKLEDAWADLGAADARRAWKAMARLMAEPAALRRLAAPRLLPRADAAKLSALVRRLDDPIFTEREAARRELAALGEAAREALEKAKTGHSLETRRTAEALLASLREAPAMERRRTRRVAEALERLKSMASVGREIHE